MAKKIIKQPLANRAVVLALQGDLGAGKTTFLQGFARGLGIKEKILSPTFVIMKKFKMSELRNLYHFDCYRVDNPQEILDLGFNEIIADSNNIVAIEWAERIKKILPRNCLVISFELVDITRRKLTFRSLKIKSLEVV